MEKKVVQRILKTRKAKGLSRENMAMDIGISISAYRKIELNQTKLTVNRLFEISRLLDTPITVLLGLKPKEIKAIKKPANKLQEKLYQDNLKNKERLIAQYKERLHDKNEIITLLKKGVTENNTPVKI